MRFFFADFDFLVLVVFVADIFFQFFVCLLCILGLFWVVGT